MCDEVKFFFTPVMTLPKEGKRMMIDATVGFGGHTNSLLDSWNLMRGKIQDEHAIFDSRKLCVHAVDADRHMLEIAQKRLLVYGDLIQFYNDFFDNYFLQIPNSSVDCILMDLGVSMYHFKESGRGFSRSENAPLDMRLSIDTPTKAFDIINTYSSDEIIKIFYDYGEERQAVKWANRIINARLENPIETVQQFCEVLQLGKKSDDRSVLTRIFQALRIAVNDELNRLCRALPEAWRVLKPGGRIAIISFHSLEDRIVKNFFKYIAAKLKNREENPMYKVAQKNNQYDTGTILTKKPVVATEKELSINIASRSAKLRVAEKRV